MTERKWTNLGTEIDKELEREGLSWGDVRFVLGSNGVVMDPEEFEGLARRVEYVDDYAVEKIDPGLVVAGDGWWLERAEYDGTEWFEFKSAPQRPETPPAARLVESSWPAKADSLAEGGARIRPDAGEAIKEALEGAIYDSYDFGDYAAAHDAEKKLKAMIGGGMGKTPEEERKEAWELIEARSQGMTIDRSDVDALCEACWGGDHAPAHPWLGVSRLRFMPIATEDDLAYALREGGGRRGEGYVYKDLAFVETEAAGRAVFTRIPENGSWKEFESLRFEGLPSEEVARTVKALSSAPPAARVNREWRKLFLEGRKETVTKEQAMTGKGFDGVSVSIPKEIGAGKESVRRYGIVDKETGEIRKMAEVTLPAHTQLDGKDLSFYRFSVKESQIKEFRNDPKYYHVAFPKSNRNGEPWNVTLRRDRGHYENPDAKTPQERGAWVKDEEAVRLEAAELEGMMDAVREQRKEHARAQAAKTPGKPPAAAREACSRAAEARRGPRPETGRTGGAK